MCAYDQLFFVQRWHGLPGADLFVHKRLGIRWLIELVMSPTTPLLLGAVANYSTPANAPSPVYDQVYDDVLSEEVPVLECHLHCPSNVLSGGRSAYSRGIGSRPCTFRVVAIDM